MPTIDVTLSTLRIECSRALDDGIAFTPAGGSDTTITTLNSEIVGLPDDYLNGAEVTLISSTNVVTVRRIDDFAVVGATATLTVRSLGFSPTSTYSGEVHAMGGRGWQKAQYDDAIKAGIRIGAHQWFTDTESLSLAYQRGGGRLEPQHDYPLPSGFHLIWEMQYLNAISAARHGTERFTTYRALGDAAARTRVGQRFQVLRDGLVEFVVVLLGKVGSPTDNLTSVVETDTADLPSGSSVTNGTSGTLAGASVQTRPRLHVLRHNPPMNLEAGTDYDLTLRRSTGTDGSNYFLLGEDDENRYGYGEMSLYDGAAWSQVTGSDLVFALFPPGPWRRLGRSFWDYRGAGTDELAIWRELPDMVPIRVLGGAAITEPSTESTNVPISADWLKAFVIATLQSGRAGAAVPDPRAIGAQTWWQAMGIAPPPFRHLPEGATMVLT